MPDNHAQLSRAPNPPDSTDRWCMIPASESALFDGNAVPQEEPQHLPGRIGAGRIGVASGRMPAGPSVTGPLDHPMFAVGLPVSGAMRRGAVIAAAGRAALAHDLLQPRVGRQRPCNHEPAIPGMHHRVGVPVKHDRRHGNGWPVSRGALLHGEKRRRSVVRGTGRKPGMHARRREHIGIGRSDDGRCRTAGGQPGNVHARGVRRMIAQDRACDPGNQRRLTSAADLVGSSEPVPAFVGIRAYRLRGVGDEKPELLGQGVHARPRREIVGRLPAAVEHHDDRHRGTGGFGPRLRRDVEFVAALALITHIAGKLERRAARNAGLGGLRGWTGRHPAGFDPANGLGQTSARLSDGFGLPHLRPRRSGFRRLGRG